MIPESLKRSLATFSSMSVTPDDDEEARLQKSILLVTTLLISFAGGIWGLLYLLAGEHYVALIPFSYSALSILNLIILSRALRFDIFRFAQILMTLLLPFLLLLALGGFVNGSVVILWAFLAPLGALLCGNRRKAVLWFFVFLASLAIAGFLTPYLRTENNLSNGFIITMYVFNVGAVSGVAFGVLLYFVKQKDLAMQLLQKNRELERTNLQQELLLRQSEKLATLGRLSAGVAHELNNPAAAAERGAAQLSGAIPQLERAQFELGQMSFSEEQQQMLAKLNELAQERAKQPTAVDALTRSKRESDIEGNLEESGLENAWEYAPILVNMGYDLNDVNELANNFTPSQFPTVVASLGSTFSAHNLLEEIGQGTSRITEIVVALKTYTYMDQAPVQFFDVHEGLDNTLVMLRSKLRKGIDVRREYAEDLPVVQGYGSELNQVWTNLIDNAIDAMDGEGNLWLRTYNEGTWVVVEIEDNGPGIPKEIEPHIFDPFYTTKSPGKGTGLGLNISHNIIAQKHNGEISVQSEPGKTSFRVKLPLRMEETDAGK
jgi:signal transduction histidine kinase